LLEAILYKEHPYRKHQLWNIVSDTPYTDVTGMMLHIKLKKNHVWKIEIKSHAGVSFLTNKYSRAGVFYKDVLYRGLLLTRKLQSYASWLKG
jgi:hypothetical protein